MLICTYGVGATGITLTRSHTVILLDRPWTPGDVLQAEDRVRRIGQKSSVVTSLWVSQFPVDNKLDQLLQTKDSHCQIVLDKASAASRKWFSDDCLQTGNIRTKTTSQSIRAFFQPEQNKSIDVHGAKMNDTSISASSTPAVCSSWNVRECEEEATSTSNSVMSELLKQLL